MPAGIAPADRRLLLIAGIVLLVLVGGTVAFAPPPAREESPAPSTYASGSGGARAAYLLLLQLRYPVRRWEESPVGLPEGGGMLVLAEPADKPSKMERASLLRFVRGGGRVLFCGPDIKSFFPGAAVSRPILDPEWQDFAPSLPSRFTRDARTISMRPHALWMNLSPPQLALYGAAPHAVIVSWRIGDGEVLWWAGATPLTNAGITKADNLNLFLDAVQSSPAEEPFPIYWDEYFHGQRGSLWSYVERTPVVWGLLQIAFLAMAVLFTFSRRSGPLLAPAVVSRLSPLEFVETLGGLYERAGATSLAVEVSYRRLRSRLAQQLALPSGVGDADLAQAAGDRLGWKTAEIRDVLDKAAAGRFRKVGPRHALALVQELERWLARLDIRKSTPVEKH